MFSLEDKNQGSPSSPSSKRSAFRPVSKMMSKVNHDFLNRDPFAEATGQSRPIHVMTPAKGKISGFFGGNSHNNATPSSSKRRTSVAGSDVSGTTSLGSSDMPPPPVPKIRAGMTPEARTRHMPAPKPTPRHALSTSTNHNNQGNGDRPSTMRLVRNGHDDHFEDETEVLPLPMVERIARNRDQDYTDPMMEEETPPGLEDISLDAWNASRGQDETVLVTIRSVHTSHRPRSHLKLKTNSLLQDPTDFEPTR